MSAKYPSLRVEGGFLAAEIIDDIAEGKATGQKPRDFGLPDQTRLVDQISAAWSDARAFWQSFWRRAEHPQEGETGVSFTRNQWAVPFFSLLGYDLALQERAAEVSGQTFAVSHRADASTNSPPVHVVGAWQSLDRRAESGRPRLAPHSLVQEYLNRTEFLFGLVTNGCTLRLLRNSQLIRRQAYIEFNLQTMFNGEHFADFALLFRLLHRSRLPHADESPEKCLLEQWYRQTIEQGGRVREHLREGVERAIPALANAIIGHPRNLDLRQRASSGELAAQTLYEELLRLVYRLLFLMVTEERNLLTENDVYRQRYSISRLRSLCENHHARNRHVDLWSGLQSTFALFHSEDYGRVLGVPPLNGDLFDLSKTSHLNTATISNADFLNALWNLAMYREDRHAASRRINYSALDVEELGSVYESLLDLQPVFTNEDGNTVFALIQGTERKTTGSYYTHPELVDELIQSALVPIIGDRLKEARTKEAKEKALLEVTICDPACGSGHFLLAAARRLARELAQIRSGEDEPSPREFRRALRDAISHCIYGVDRNPLAVELCRVALWLESHAEGKPLSFLDHRILCGNSLVGVRDLSTLRNGIPEDAFKPVSGDDKKTAQEIRKRNRNETAGALVFSPAEDVSVLAEVRKELFEMPDDSPEQVRHKRTILELAHSNRRYIADQRAADLWCAAFFVEFSETNFHDNLIPTNSSVLDALDGRQLYGPMVGCAAEIDSRVRFFHWPLEYPEVFAKGGFDVVLGNPPWEKIQVEEKPFFASRNLAIAHATGARRKELIRNLGDSDPALHTEFTEHRRDVELTDKFLKESGLFPLTGLGKMNTYAIFCELFVRILKPDGSAGILTPLGIATDDNNKGFFASLIAEQRLVSLVGFENEEFIFPEVHHAFKFAALTIRSAGAREQTANFLFFARRLEDLRDHRRRFELSREEILSLNPNTATAPIFRTSIDAELNKRAYRAMGVLVDEARSQNDWELAIHRMFNPTDDSRSFFNESQLIEAGFRIVGNEFRSDERSYVPVYQAKMIHQYDHRFGTYQDQSAAQAKQGKLPELSSDEHKDPCLLPLPPVWVDRRTAKEFIDPHSSREWLFAFRRITGPVLIRTAIAAIIPRTAAVDPCRLVYFHGTDAPQKAALFLTCFNSLAFDYYVRQKVSGTDLSIFIMKQLPVMPPSAYSPEGIDFLIPRALELTCTAWDIQPFLDDAWREGEANLRSAIERQWRDNREATDGHTYDSPEWYIPPEDCCPLPPFKWDEGRRARLRAEIDAYYAMFYGLDERELRYILDPTDVYGPDFPSETFRVLKEKEIARYGEYRTQRLVLDAFRKLSERRGVAPGLAQTASPVLTYSVSALHAVPAGAWATPQGVTAESVALLALIDVLRAFAGPADPELVRIAAIIVRKPALGLAFMDDNMTHEWARVIGQEARPLPANVIDISRFQNAAADHAWGEAVMQLTGSGGLVATAGLWQPGNRLPASSGEEWIVGRAAVAVHLLSKITSGQACTDIEAYIRSVEDGAPKRAVS